MKRTLRLLSLFVTVVLVLQAISTLAARRQAVRTAATQTDNEEETFVIAREGNGKTVCRIANAQEHDEIVNRDRNGKFKLIYRGAPVKPRVSLSSTWIEPTTGLTLQPSVGLHIVLHGTTQLDQNPQAKNAFIVAANRWEAIISTPITVVIDVDFGTTFFGTPFSDPSILGLTGSQAITSPYTTVRQRLVSTASSQIEQQLYDALPATAVPVDVNGTISNVSSVRASIANARALGLSPDITNPDSLPLGQGDAGIGFNSAFSFDFNPDDGINANQTDFDSVATHEIGHALGFTSRSGQASVTQVAVWDLFRLSRFDANLAVFTTAPRTMSIGGEQFFFPNQVTTFGTTALELSTGGPNPGPNDGDGRQSSHWKDDDLLSTAPYIGIMDPTLDDGLRRTISENDIHAIDLFGYSIGLAPPVRPTNDNFANAITPQGNAGTLTGSNVNATREPGEPIHVGFLGDKSVWYNWTATLNGQITIDTIGSNFDTTLAVYLGSSVNLLSNVAQNDDIVAGTNRASRVQFNTTAGTTYRIVVDGWNGEFGNITLNWSATGVTPTPTPTPTPIPTPTPSPSPTPTATPVADLAIDSFTASANPAVRTQMLTFTAIARNVGPESATATIVVDVPVGSFFVSCSPQCSPAQISRPAVRTDVTLGPGATGSLTVNVLVDTTSEHVLVAVASVGGSVVDTNLSNNTAFFQVKVIEPLPFAGAQAIAMDTQGSHALALRNGTVWAWGSNSSGQLGDGTTTSRTYPAQVDDLMSVTQIDAGTNFSVALKSDGTVWTWGTNLSGQLGIGRLDPILVSRPVRVAGLNSIVAISAGTSHVLALKSDGTVWGWGNNFSGQLGLGNTSPAVSVPTMAPNFSGVKAIFAGSERSWLVDGNDAVWAFGFNFGALGDGTQAVFTATPTIVSSLSGLKRVGSGTDFTVITRNDNTALSFGRNTFGVLGLGPVDLGVHPSPAQIPGLQAALVSAGTSHAIVTAPDGTVSAFGSNQDGQLGLGVTDNNQHNTPVSISGLSSVFATAAGGSTSFALVGDLANGGEIRTWGRTLGTASAFSISSPQTVMEVPVVAKPIFTIPGGGITAPIQVSVACGTPGAVIHFTTNGQDPTESDPVAQPNIPIVIDHTTVLKARAFRSGFSNSPIKTAHYIFTTAANLLDDQALFVRQQYLDFLGREPDLSGLNFWTNEITSCGSDQSCIEIKRINVSAAFFLSIEFQQTGFLVERTWDAAFGGFFGDSTLGGNHQLLMPIVLYQDFFTDKELLGKDVIVGEPGWQDKLENNTQAYFDSFVQKGRFKDAFPVSMTAAQFVDALNANTNGALSTAERNQLVQDLNSGLKTRAQVLRAVAEDSDLGAREFNRAFVLMQYYGYLRRNPNGVPDTDFTGYDFWLTKLNQFNGNFINAEMVKAFIQSIEYRQRFAP